jgi:hypothetical protein
MSGKSYRFHHPKPKKQKKPKKVKKPKIVIPDPDDLVRIAITGSSARQPEDKKLLMKEHMEWMHNRIRFFIQLMNLDPKKIMLMSNGSAWADHVAVQLYLTWEFYGIELYLPSKFDIKQRKYINTHEGRKLNELHSYYNQVTGVNPFDELLRAIHGKDRARVTIKRGYKQRNTLMAGNCDYLIAFTFSDTVPTRGGTVHTWNRYDTYEKIHFNLGFVNKKKIEDTTNKVTDKVNGSAIIEI